MKATTELIQKYTSQYYNSLEKYAKLKTTGESTTEQAFKRLLNNVSDDLNLTLIKVSESISRKGKIIPDGIIVNQFNLRIGFWEAKDTNDDLRSEILKKIDKGYPLTNTIFEDTKTAYLYQNGIKVSKVNLKEEIQVANLLVQFFNYNEPILEEFRQAIEKFKADIPNISEGFLKIIQKAKKTSKEFSHAVGSFMEICSNSFHSEVTESEIEDMLIQHLITERVFRKVFDNAEFVNNNVIAKQLEKLIEILTKNHFDRGSFFKSINFFYQAIEQKAANIDDFSEKQGFLNTIYEIFFQSYSKKNADKNGIVYTPQSIVRFMVKCTNQLLQSEFGLSLSSEGVNIIDPCTGTGNFVMEILRNIKPEKLHYKYKNEIFCNEIMLLPYYIASVNIEYYYYQTTGEYLPFQNIVFTDTLELIIDKRQRVGQQGALNFVMNEANTERANRQLTNPLFAIIGNPPYNAQQQNENENNKNKKNRTIDRRIAETYAKESKAQLRNKLYDPYVKFFRWATDRLPSDKGIVAFVTNNSFMSDIQFDGMRKLLLQDFHRIYHFDLGGDVNANPKLSGSKHNIFGIKVGVGITFLVKNPIYADHKIFTMSWDTYLDREAKEKLLDSLTENLTEVENFEWVEGYIDANNNFSFNQNNIVLAQEYEHFLPLHNDRSPLESIFTHKYPAISTKRNEWVYDFSRQNLTKKTKTMIAFYNTEVERFKDHLQIENLKPYQINVDNFVKNEDSKIKWSEGLKQKLKAVRLTQFDVSSIENALFRPFIHKPYYSSRFFTDRPSLFNLLQETNNTYLLLSGLGSKKISTLITNLKPDHDSLEKTQAFPLFYVEEHKEMTNKGEETMYRSFVNISDWMRDKYLNLPHIQGVKPKDNWYQEVFEYVYGILHHAGFKARYSNLLKTTPPRIPWLPDSFEFIATIGKSLMEVHLNFEQMDEFELTPTKKTEKLLETSENIDWSIDKIKLKNELLLYNSDLSFELPDEAFGYDVNGRTPLEWIADQYKNYPAKDDHVLRLIQKCITVTQKSSLLITSLNAIYLK